MRNLKKVLALVLALVMSLSLVTIANAADFSDSKDISYKEAVDVMTAIGVIDGLDTGAFNPTGTLTREQAAKIICTMMLGSGADKLGTTSSSFTDVAATRWSSPYIEYCASIGIIAGNGDGTYNPTGKLTGYAFAKMLLGALGYSSDYEGYTGAGWTIEVAKDAVTAGITVDGVALNGQLTREQATQMAFQALQATLVEYKTAGTSIVTPDGFTVVTAGSTASKVENNATKAGYDGDKDGFQQFCEEYFADLKLNSNSSDDFGRPASKWTYKTKTVGTYADKASASYTEDVKLGDIYSDLGLSERTEATFIRNGVEGTKAVLYRGNSTKIGTGNGVLTEAFVDDDNNVTLVAIDTYVGQVSRTVAETSSRDAYIVIVPQAKKPAAGNLEFETNVSYDDDAYVLYTYADGEVQSVALAEMVSGTVSSYVTDKSLNLGGTSYKYAAQISGTTAPTPKSDYDVYLDQYGYAIYVDEQEFVSSDYAYVIAAQGGGDFTENKAKLVFTDGSTKIVDTEKNYSTYANAFVTYKVNDDGTYTLRKVTSGITSISANGTFSLKKGTAAITTGGTPGTIYANSNTIFIVMTKNSDGEAVYKTYTGISNVPSITAKATSGEVSAEIYCKTSGMATIMYINASAADASISTSSKDVTFVAAKSEGGPINTSDGTYYTYNAVVNGEVTTIKADEKISANKVYGSVTYDDDVIDVSAAAEHTNKVVPGTAGTVKMSGDSTIGFGNGSSVEYWTVAKDCKVFYINVDGEITESSLSSISTDTDDTVLAVKDEGELTYIFVQEVTAGTSDPGGSTSGEYSVSLAKDGSTKITLTVKSTATDKPTAKVTGTIKMSGSTTLTADLTGVTEWTGSANNWTCTAVIANTSSNTVTYQVDVVIGNSTLTTSTLLGG